MRINWRESDIGKSELEALGINTGEDLLILRKTVKLAHEEGMEVFPVPLDENPYRLYKADCSELLGMAKNPFELHRLVFRQFSNCGSADMWDRAVDRARKNNMILCCNDKGIYKLKRIQSGEPVRMSRNFHRVAEVLP
jgi:hypothetical protein